MYAAGNVVILSNSATVNTPVSGDKTVRNLPDFTPSAGNLWAQPGVHQATTLGEYNNSHRVMRILNRI